MHHGKQCDCGCSEGVGGTRRRLKACQTHAPFTWATLEYENRVHAHFVNNLSQDARCAQMGSTPCAAALQAIQDAALAKRATDGAPSVQPSEGASEMCRLREAIGSGEMANNMVEQKRQHARPRANSLRTPQRIYTKTPAQWRHRVKLLHECDKLFLTNTPPKNPLHSAAPREKEFHPQNSTSSGPCNIKANLTVAMRTEHQRPKHTIEGEADARRGPPEGLKTCRLPTLRGRPIDATPRPTPDLSMSPVD